MTRWKLAASPTLTPASRATKSTNISPRQTTVMARESAGASLQRRIAVSPCGTLPLALPPAVARQFRRPRQGHHDILVLLQDGVSAIGRIAAAHIPEPNTPRFGRHKERAAVFAIDQVGQAGAWR